MTIVWILVGIAVCVGIDCAVQLTVMGNVEKLIIGYIIEDIMWNVEVKKWDKEHAIK
jgi:hypothetical protein